MVRVEMYRDQKRALVACGGCGIRQEFLIKPVQTEIDVYCMFTDKFYEGYKRPSTTEIKST